MARGPPTGSTTRALLGRAHVIRCAGITPGGRWRHSRLPSAGALGKNLSQAATFDPRPLGGASRSPTSARTPAPRRGQRRVAGDAVGRYPWRPQPTDSSGRGGDPVSSTTGQPVVAGRDTPSRRTAGQQGWRRAGSAAASVRGWRSNRRKQLRTCAQSSNYRPAAANYMRRYPAPAPAHLVAPWLSGPSQRGWLELAEHGKPGTESGGGREQLHQHQRFRHISGDEPLMGGTARPDQAIRSSISPKWRSVLAAPVETTVNTI